MPYDGHRARTFFEELYIRMVLILLELRREYLVVTNQTRGRAARNVQKMTYSLADLTEKAQLFIRYFILKCTTIDTGSVIPQRVPVTTPLIGKSVISEEKILNMFGSLKGNINKAHGWDEMSVRMTKVGDAALIVLLKIIFSNCLRHELFPEIWTHANVVPVHKGNEKISKEATVQFLSFQFLGKYLTYYYAIHYTLAPVFPLSTN